MYIEKNESAVRAKSFFELIKLDVLHSLDCTTSTNAQRLRFITLPPPPLMRNVLDFGVVPPSRTPSRVRAEQPRLAAKRRHLAEVVVQRRDPQHQPPLGLVRLAPVPVPLVVRPNPKKYSELYCIQLKGKS